MFGLPKPPLPLTYLSNEIKECGN
uniref:Uncharacterized protein n=1 Tax=Anguilla anguilla TaxID=7936 RepID=A0A0E9R0M5_ANGAN